MKRFKRLSAACLFSVILVLTACGDGRPDGVLSKEKMQAVLWDVAMAGEFANGYVYYQRPQADRLAVNNKLLAEICRIHGISRENFEKSLDYYKQRPKIFMAILDSITAEQTGVRPGPESGSSITPPTVPIDGGINNPQYREQERSPSGNAPAP